MKLRNLTCVFGAIALLCASAAFADPDIRQYAVPATLHSLVATGRTVWADQTELSKIGKDFGEAYRLHEATYTFTAPDRLEYKAKVGIISVTTRPPTRSASSPSRRCTSTRRPTSARTSPGVRLYLPWACSRWITS